MEKKLTLLGHVIRSAGTDHLTRKEKETADSREQMIYELNGQKQMRRNFFRVCHTWVGNHFLLLLPLSSLLLV